MSIFVMYGNKGLLKQFFTAPFTTPPDKQKFQIEISELEIGRHKLPYPLETKLLNHSAPVMGMRFELEGKSIVYCSDTGYSENTIILANKTDLLIHECGFFKPPKGRWGHVTPEEAAEIAKKSETNRLVLIHFSANEYHSLKQRKDAEQRARKIFQDTTASYDGMTLEL